MSRYIGHGDVWFYGVAGEDERVVADLFDTRDLIAVKAILDVGKFSVL